jgi:hypothetical protein
MAHSWLASVELVEKLKALGLTWVTTLQKNKGEILKNSCNENLEKLGPLYTDL